MNKQMRVFSVGFVIAITMLCTNSVFSASYTLGTEFKISTYTTSDQRSSSVTSNGTDYMVTWTSDGQDGYSLGIYGQRVDSSGNLQGNEFRVNTYTTKWQRYSSVTSNGTDYMATWSSYEQDGIGYGIYGQRIDSSGSFKGNEFRINTRTASSQYYPSVTSNGTDYMVTWQSHGQDGSDEGIYGQRIDSAGSFKGNEFKINTYTQSSQSMPSVTSNGTDYMVTWQSLLQDGSNEGIYGQRINSLGNLQGNEFRVNTYTTNYQDHSSLASNGTDYLIIWASEGQDGSHRGIYGQSVDSAGNFIGDEFRVNTYTAGSQISCSVTSNGTDYLITWASANQDGNGYGIYGQRIDSSGNFIDDEFLINTFTTSHQKSPSITSDGTDYLVTWASDGQDGSGLGIYGKMIYTTATVPEPASILLLISAIGALFTKRYRR